MATYYRTTITQVGPDVADLVEGGILILFAEGSPPELAEVSALHRVEDGPTSDAPPVGTALRVGALEATITAIGSLAWAKVAEMGHVVINFDGAQTSGRPGELSVSSVDTAELARAVQPGAAIVIGD